MTSRQALVAANWKMNGTLESIRPLVDEIRQGLQQGSATRVVICAPYVYLQELRAQLGNTAIACGAQTVSEHESGAYTGEISVAMLQDFGCEYVIVGHSERRHIYAESDEIVAEKFLRVVEAGMIPILCLGEQLQEREAGDTETVVARQLKAVIDLAGVAAFNNAVIAYEPVWAIGTGRTATPEQAQEVHSFIRLQLGQHDGEIADRIQLLYGGSVKADNAADLFSRADIDGGLIGGASLVAQDFLTICQSTR